MTGDRLKASHARRSETLAQRVDQRRTAFGAVVILGGCREFGLVRRHALGARYGKADRFEAKSRVLHCRKRFELERDESCHMVDIARRQRQRDVDRLNRAIDVVE